MVTLGPLDQARRSIEEAVSIDDARVIRDKAEAARAYARQIGESLELQNQCCELKLRAERRMGAMLESSPRQGPGEYKRSQDATVPASLRELGITKSQSSRWQMIARLSKADFEDFIEATKVSGKELTSAAALRLAKRHEAQNSSPKKAQSEPAAQQVFASELLDELVSEGENFGCILADPPWSRGVVDPQVSTKGRSHAALVPELTALPVRALAAEQAHLHLWTTNAFLFEARELLEAWGFEYKSVLVWVRPRLGGGDYWRVSHEYLMLGVRGKAPFNSGTQRSWFEAEQGRRGERPALVRELLEEVSRGPYLELFSQTEVPGWTVWGGAE